MCTQTLHSLGEKKNTFKGYGVVSSKIAALCKVLFTFLLKDPRRHHVDPLSGTFTGTLTCRRAISLKSSSSTLFKSKATDTHHTFDSVNT